jgi:hypothetical protein
MEPHRLRPGRAIPPEEFERPVPKAYREFLPGKDSCADGHVYLHDGTACSFFKGGPLDA